MLSRRSDTDSVEIADLRTGSATALLGGTFNAYVQDRARLTRQLELAGCVAETLGVREVTIPPTADAREVASAIAESLG